MQKMFRIIHHKETPIVGYNNVSSNYEWKEGNAKYYRARAQKNSSVRIYRSLTPR